MNRFSVFQKIVVMATFTGVVSCSATERNTESNEQVSAPAGTFISYLQSLGHLSLPVSLQSDLEDFPLPPENFDSVAYQKFKHSYALQPVGILYESPEYIAVLEYSGGDLGLVPLLTTYTAEGVKLDSLAPYSLSGSDIGYQASETVVFKKDKSIEVTAQITKSEVKDGDIVAGTESVTTKATSYQLLPNGKFSVAQ